jgi:nucleotide-binding universal stress UspA family protein
MQTILVPTDFSETALHAAQYAIHFAKQVGATKIILFHAIDDYFESGREAKTIELEWEFYDHVVKEREKELEEFRLKLMLYDSSVTLETHCETVRLSEAINEICKSFSADVVITGRINNDTLTESLFGNNVISLANESETPLVIVPPDVVFDPLNEILLACNFKKITEAAPAAPIKDLLDATKAKIFVLHVEEQSNDEQQPVESEALTALLKNYDPEYHNLPSEDFRLAINEFVSNKKIDLIITIPKKHGLFDGLFKKNYTKELAYHTHVPLMVLHD